MMSSEKVKRLSVRGLVSTIMTLAFAVLVVSGVVLFLSPPGRIAHWTGWAILWLTKDQWSALHIWFAILFAISSAIHIYLNWRALLGYFKSRLTRQLAFRREWTLAVLLTCGLFAVVLLEVPPVSSFLAWNEAFKESWAQEEQQPPIPHAELLSLSQLADKTGIAIEVMIANLKAQGITVASPDDIVEHLAEQNGISPDILYRAAVGSGSRSQSGGGRGGGGAGQKTLEQYCAQEGMSLAEVLARLSLAEIEADKTMLLRDIARKNGMRPPDLVTIIKEEADRQ
ncbi:DUF4405 domain-containing protein [Candidatus Sumerlaeota bacterium]